jgi:selenide,water dikinase
MVPLIANVPWIRAGTVRWAGADAAADADSQRTAAAPTASPRPLTLIYGLSMAHAEAPRLTSLSHGAGCGCKLPARELHEILGRLELPADERVIVGLRTGDDAGLVRISDELALVQTVDFFTPVVDDPRAFGAIAAANALSDVYAMGGRPLSALSIVGFPLERLGEAVLEEILAGAIEIVSSAGAALVGGHSIDDPEPKFGLAVTGLVDPSRAVTNSGGQPGDVLFLSKPLGTGAIVTAAQHDEVEERTLSVAVKVMGTLNEAASRRAVEAGAHAMTDVSGFGLLGHLHTLALQSEVRAELDADAVPALAAGAGLLRSGQGISSGTRRNLEWATEQFAFFSPTVPEWRCLLLADATTSGGILAAVPEAGARALEGAPIGRLVEGQPGTIAIT